MLNHRQLSHALTLFKCGKFTRAAAELHISQSALSRSIGSLEKQLGVVLFHRDARHVVPTEYGKVFLRRAAVIVADTQDLVREFQLLQGLELGSFSVALGIYPAEISGNHALGKMVSSYPNLLYQITSGDWQHVNQQVLSGAADLGFAATGVAEKSDRLRTENVSQHELFLYCRKDHPLAASINLGREDIDQFPLVSIRVPGELADEVPGKSQHNRGTGYLTPSVQIEDFATARQIIANSDGVGAAVPYQIESQLESGEFRLLDYQRPWLKPLHGFILLQNRSVSPAAEVFMENVIAIEKTISRINNNLIRKYCR
jgi:DNA-binding transcriptional LysR family regulator